MLIADPTASAAAQAFEVPAVIAGSVNLLRFSAALAKQKKLVPIVWDMPVSELPGWTNHIQAIDLAGA